MSIELIYIIWEWRKSKRTCPISASICKVARYYETARGNSVKISSRFLASQIMYINIKGSHKVEPFLVREGFKITKFWIDSIRILSFTFAKINPVLNALITSPYFPIYHWIFFVELSLMTVRAGYDNNSNTIPPARENMMTSF